MTPSSLPSVSRRKHYRPVPGPPTEPTSTLVLTSPRGYYVDVRVNKTPQSPPPPNTFDGHLAWAFAGTKSTEQTSEKNRTISTWHHPIDSLSDDPPPDVGEMIELDNGDVLERGESVVDNETGAVQRYEELWDEILSQRYDRTCVVLRTTAAPAPSSSGHGGTTENDAARGMAIRIGEYCQGILKTKKDGCTVERWQWIMGERSGWWERLERFGVGELPCEGLANGGLAEKEEGEEVDVGGVVWEVVEVARW